MYNQKATNNLQDGGPHFATLLTITSLSSSNFIVRKLDGWGSPSDDTAMVYQAAMAGALGRMAAPVAARLLEALAPSQRAAALVMARSEDNFSAVLVPAFISQ